MKPLKAAPLVAFFSVSALHTSSGQLDTRPTTTPRSEIAIGAGLGQTAQLDATASPLQFGGRGVDARARYARVGGRYAITATADAGQRSLTADGSATAAAERSTAGQLRVDVRRGVGASPDAGFAIGLDFTTVASVTAHHYNDPTHSVSDFIIGAVTLGPTASFRHAIAGGLASFDMSIPAVGWVDHPYADARTTTSRIDARFATASTLHGIDGGVAYSPAALQRFGLEYSYRVRVFHYADVQPLRSVTQSLSISVVRRFGGSGDNR